ncbi:MAG: fibronectin type III domain-containing protein [Candidatus Moranbacteria bacterium]|jgi:hypothetical protein|nr:fibronectin type III domain-containing protein [Candidatus Moranbacteria bacterium]MDD5652400.1 fibronectin type III domain-containing protein [Candidatus Moranbacteria bacterium]MDX9855736.1 fibronectin type III domain-containing protein [Candidatus Moranbacteria bacterium]
MSYFSKKPLAYLRNKKARVLALSVGLVLVFASVIYVTATDSDNIDSQYKYAWNENAGWLNFGSSDGGVMVKDLELTGYAWSENLGWISLNCSNNNSCSTSDFKVSNDGEGNLSGYAWGENVGFINFAPTNGGVAIDFEGVFSGYAWGENIGWIAFNCSNLNVCANSDFKVKTSWIPLSARDNESSDEEDEDDEEELEISKVRYSSTDTTIEINWKTNNNADSHVRYGKDKNLSEEKDDNKEEKKHHTVLKDLDSNTKYYFRIRSTDNNDSTDTSKVYSISTKSAPISFVGYEDWDNGKYEKVEMEVSDEDEDIKEEMIEEKEEKENISEKEVSEITVPEKKPSIIARTFDLVRNTASGIFSGGYRLALAGQRGIMNAFDTAGEGIINTYVSVASKFNKEKATQIAKSQKEKLFTTEIFKKDESKFLAEAKFQILDKSENPIPRLETTLFSDPQTTVTDDDGIATFKEVLIGSHTLAFEHEGESFRKKVAISDTLTEEGKVRMEVVQVKAQKEKLALWMWGIIILLVAFIFATLYFARKYYRLLNVSRG